MHSRSQIPAIVAISAQAQRGDPKVTPLGLMSPQPVDVVATVEETEQHEISGASAMQGIGTSGTSAMEEIDELELKLKELGQKEDAASQEERQSQA